MTALAEWMNQAAQAISFHYLVPIQAVAEIIARYAPASDAERIVVFRRLAVHREDEIHKLTTERDQARAEITKLHEMKAERLAMLDSVLKTIREQATQLDAARKALTLIVGNAVNHHGYCYVCKSAYGHMPICPVEVARAALETPGATP